VFGLKLKIEKALLCTHTEFGKGAFELRKDVSEKGVDQLSGFSTGSVHVGFVVDRVALALGFFY
jgi:hypothetical protein